MIFNKKTNNAENQKSEESNVKNAEDRKLIEDLKKCQDDLAKITKERDDYLSGWQRERADFSNYKKEQAEFFDGFKKFATEDFVLEILPVLDSFEMAILHLPRDIKENEWVKGIIQTKEQIKNVLKNQGVEEIKSEGEKFNPEFHEAVERVESEGEDGVIIEEIQKGYLMHGKAIRPARVKVSVKQPTTNN